MFLIKNVRKNNLLKFCIKSNSNLNQIKRNHFQSFVKTLDLKQYIKDLKEIREEGGRLVDKKYIDDSDLTLLSPKYMTSGSLKLFQVKIRETNYQFNDIPLKEPFILLDSNLKFNSDGSVVHSTDRYDFGRYQEYCTKRIVQEKNLKLYVISVAMELFLTLNFDTKPFNYRHDLKFKYNVCPLKYYISGCSDAVVINELDSQTLVHILCKPNTDQSFDKNYAQLIGESIGIAFKNATKKSMKSQSIFSIMIRGLEFSFFRFEISSEYLRQIGEQEELKESLIVEHFNASPLNFIVENDKHLILNILYEIQSKILRQLLNTIIKNFKHINI